MTLEMYAEMLTRYTFIDLLLEAEHVRKELESSNSNKDEPKLRAMLSLVIEEIKRVA